MNYDGLIKCSFSCDSNKNIILMKEDKLEIIHTSLNKTVFKMQPNVQEFMNLVDF